MNPLENRILKIISLHISILVFLVFFQNCSESNFNTQDNLSLGPFTTPQNATTTYINTKMNTPITFTLRTPESLKPGSLVLKNQPRGTILINSVEQLNLTYTPPLGFKGKDFAQFKSLDQNTNNFTTLLVQIDIGNPLHDLEPALAVRGVTCISCHAKVSSNIITDFGYGDSYYFGITQSSPTWPSYSPYGGTDQLELRTMEMTKPNLSIIVPKAPLHSQVSAQRPQRASLADYVKQELLLAKPSVYDNFFDPQNQKFLHTRNTSVLAKSFVYIGAPTEEDIQKKFQLTSRERFKYFPENLSFSASLTNFVDKGSYFTIKDSFSCNGDLAIRGPLLIENLSLNTLEGCRLYVIGSVFIFGPIQYLGSSTKRNLQISSSRSINLGLGKINSSNEHCSSDYNQNHLELLNYSSLKTRYTVTGRTLDHNYLRQSLSPLEFGTRVESEARTIESGEKITFMDAACRPERRAVSFERLLLNAPAVHSRYQGSYSGSIIAEIAVGSLEKFVFSFDPVFSSVPILPFLDSKTYLEIRD
jgi:hypothetical protein